MEIDDAEDLLPLGHKIDLRDPVLLPSFIDAMRMFVVARAIRRLRGDGTAHMSMLVNASRFVVSRLN